MNCSAIYNCRPTEPLHVVPCCEIRVRWRSGFLGDVLSEIDVQTASGIVTSVIPTRSVRELDLKVGSEVIAFVKSTEVSIAKL